MNPCPEGHWALRALGRDALGRRLHDLRISSRPLQLPLHLLHAARRVGPTTRSSRRRIAELPRNRAAAASSAARLQKVRLTGGEPLLRKNLERLIEMLANIPAWTYAHTNVRSSRKKARR